MANFRWRQVQDENQSLYELGLHERGEILCEFQVGNQVEPYFRVKNLYLE